MAYEPALNAELPKLKRVLGLGDLIVYGIVLIQPIAPVGIFGLVLAISQGQAGGAILFATVAMMFTASSYGRMAALYPSAGSAYTYVGKGLNAHLGFLAGWAMILDYLLIPIINTIYLSLTMERLLPGVPYVVWVSIFAAMITLLNLRGIRATARANTFMLYVMTVVIGAFVVLAIRYIVGAQGWHGVVSTAPFFNPKSFRLGSLSAATSLAALTYIGFDGVTTLAEDVKNPRRNVLWGVILVCGITGVFSTVEVYLAQLAWPNYRTFPDLATAFLDVSRRVGGIALFQAVALVLVVACLGSGLTGQVGAARLLFGMGRDRVLPQRVFAHLSPKGETPSYNICIVGLLAWAGSMLLSYEHAAELLNFGAFLAFMGVNVATVRAYYLKRQAEGSRNFLRDALIPTLGFLFCLWIWAHLATPAKVVGSIWFGVGVVYLAVNTHGFRVAPVMIDFRES